MDLNVLVAPDEAPVVLRALPAGASWSDTDLATIRRDGQVRLWWETTPIDLFFNTTPFHEQLAGRTRREPFLDEHVPFLGCGDLAVFKVFFDRSQDWADLEAMAAAGTLDVPAVAAALIDHLGADDARIRRLHRLE